MPPAKDELGHLYLMRHIGKSIVINGNITVKVLSIRKGEVRLGIEAPQDVPIHRGEFEEWKP